MDTVELIQSEIFRLRRANRQPRFIYVGETEYRDIVNSMPALWYGYRDEFMGIEMIRVDKESHINVTE